jgi:pimeloyl-ACP methyl ester carboxylesterase
VATPSPPIRETETYPVEPAQDVTIEGAAGLMLRGTWRTASRVSPAVLLLHMYGGSRIDWGPEAEILQQAGIASLAIDLRGQGETGGAEDWGLAVEDLSAAHAWIERQPAADAERRGTVGASIGANLALTHAARDPSIRAVALLSPGMDYFGVSLEGLMAVYGERPILLAASAKDTYSADTIQVLAGEGTQTAVPLLYPGSSHGTELLYRTQGLLLEELIRFLQESLAPATPSSPG